MHIRKPTVVNDHPVVCEAYVKTTYVMKSIASGAVRHHKSAIQVFREEVDLRHMACEKRSHNREEVVLGHMASSKRELNREEVDLEHMS